MIKSLDPRLRAGLDSVQADAPLSPFTESLLAAVAVYYDGRLSWQHLFYPLFNARFPGVFLYAHTVPRPESFSAALDKTRWMLTGTLINLYVHGRIIDLLRAPLLRLGVWEEYAARLDTHTTQLEGDLEPLRGFAHYDPEIADALRGGQFPDDPNFCEEWDVYMERHGHRASNDLDLAAPRLCETPERVLPRILDTPPIKPPRSPLGLLMLPLGWLASRQIDERDRFLFHAALAYHNMRRHFLALARAAVERGQLERAELIWTMDVEAVRRLDESA